MSHLQRDLRILAIAAPAWMAAYWYGFGADAGLLRLWCVFPLSFVASAFANATSVGGGFIFIPLWTLVFRLEPMTALKLSLATEAVGMTCGALEWGRERRVPRLLWAVVGASSAGALIGTLWLKPSALHIKGVFGLVSVAMGLLTLKMLDYHGQNEAPSSRWLFYPLSLVGGLVTAWISIGSGSIIAVALMLIYGVRAERAIGTGVLALSANAVLATACHLASGGMTREICALLMLTVPAVLFGSRVGVRIGARAGQRALKLVFAAVAIVDGILMLAVLVHGLATKA